MTYTIDTRAADGIYEELKRREREIVSDEYERLIDRIKELEAENDTLKTLIANARIEEDDTKTSQR